MHTSGTVQAGYSGYACIGVPETWQTENIALCPEHSKHRGWQVCPVVYTRLPLLSKQSNNTHGQQNHRSTNPNSYKEHEHEINTANVQFPLRISSVGWLERLNQLSINVFSLDRKSNIVPIRMSEAIYVTPKWTIDLLYIVHDMQSHYCLFVCLFSPRVPSPLQPNVKMKRGVIR